jgi:hypothetical protein
MITTSVSPLSKQSGERSNLRKYRPSKAKRKSLTVYFTPDDYNQFRALADSQALFYGELAELLLREYLRAQSSAASDLRSQQSKMETFK